MAHCRPQASFTDSFEEIFPSRMVFITKLNPQVSLSPVPFFGVNICPLQLRDKSDFIPELTINAQQLQVKSVQHHFLFL
jgi:hypothetical protein